MRTVAKRNLFTGTRKKVFSEKARTAPSRNRATAQMLQIDNFIKVVTSYFLTITKQKRCPDLHL
ncbi:MAG: hypothetical protein WCQ55_04450, partial [Paludibacteraceae bacterium]